MLDIPQGSTGIGVLKLRIQGSLCLVDFRLKSPVLNKMYIYVY
jgi:hypothetical protein